MSLSGIPSTNGKIIKKKTRKSLDQLFGHMIAKSKTSGSNVISALNDLAANRTLKQVLSPNAAQKEQLRTSPSAQSNPPTSPVQINQPPTSPIHHAATSNQAAPQQEPETLIDYLPLPPPENRRTVDPSLFLAQPGDTMVQESEIKNKDGKAIYKCRAENCKYDSDRKYNTLRHVRTHYKDNRVKCRVINCGASFVDFYIGKDHLANVHGIGSGNRSKDGEETPGKKAGKKRKSKGGSAASKGAKINQSWFIPPPNSADSSPIQPFVNVIPNATSMLGSSSTTTSVTTRVSPIPYPQALIPTTSLEAVKKEMNNNERDFQSKMLDNPSSPIPQAVPARPTAPSPPIFPEPEQVVSSQQ